MAGRNISGACQAVTSQPTACAAIDPLSDGRELVLAVERQVAFACGATRERANLGPHSGVRIT